MKWINFFESYSLFVKLWRLLFTGVDPTSARLHTNALENFLGQNIIFTNLRIWNSFANNLQHFLQICQNLQKLQSFQRTMKISVIVQHVLDYFVRRMSETRVQCRKLYGFHRHVHTYVCIAQNWWCICNSFTNSDMYNFVIATIKILNGWTIPRKAKFLNCMAKTINDI